MGKNISGGGWHSRQDPCAYCGRGSSTWDHLVPKSQGGSNDGQNLTRSCGRCNNLKGDLSVLHFLAYRANGTIERINEERMWAHAEIAKQNNKLLRRFRRKAEREARILIQSSGTQDSYKSVLSAILNDLEYAKQRGWIV